MVSGKVNLGGYDFTLRSPQFVDQSSLDFFRQTWEQLQSMEYLSGDIHSQILKSSKIGSKFVCFCLPEFFLRNTPKLLDPIFKTQPTTDDGAKFHSDRPMELRDSMAKQINKKHLQ